MARRQQAITSQADIWGGIKLDPTRSRDHHQGMIAPVKPHWYVSFEQDLRDTDPATSEDIDDGAGACLFTRKINDVGFLEHVQEFRMNTISPFAVRILQM